MNKKNIFLIIITTFVLIEILFFSPTLTKNKDICSEQGVIFLKPDERGEASALIKSQKVVVIIPETKDLLGNSDQLNCPNFKLPLSFIGVK